ncbi:hypothetical protein GH5_03417 [Leishmania sp. Ghana 2012 LV757]|uniref:hypothetical protein n=1 Tax=Leishmania sp. Ghana 2012 LV757 TaxID=2803181 RepID=UPI001B5A48EC|nr:hypothetical protein GH5_03417 [Leishmania sp. Ghana 2012 LV757]
MNYPWDAPQCGAEFPDVCTQVSEDSAPVQQRAQRVRYLTPPRLCIESVDPVVSLASSAGSLPASAAADATIPTSSALPQLCGGTTEAPIRLVDTQRPVASAAFVESVVQSSPSLPALRACAATAAATDTSSTRRFPPKSSSSVDSASMCSHNVEGARALSLCHLTTSSLTLRASASLPIPGEETVCFTKMGSYGESSSETPSAPPLCCGLPQVHASEQERQASSAETFLNVVPPPQGDRVTPSLQPLSPTEVSGAEASCTVTHQSADAVDTRGAASPLLLGSESPSDVANATPTLCTPQRRNQSFDTPLPLTTGGNGGSCDDVTRYYPERREPSTTTASLRTSGQVSERLGDTRRPPPLMYPSNSTVTLSTLRTPLVDVASPVTAHFISNNGSGGGTAIVSSNTSTSDADAEAQVVTDAGLRRAASSETLASVSSSRSRPVLTPAALGPPGASGAASGTTSTTNTSVTYTRKNVCLGALDFYGNPLTSLSSLLVQMSLQSGDHEEAEQPETRFGAASPYPSIQQHQRNTLSMQNLKAHTQQVGQMAPEDKVKRFRAKPESGGVGLYRTAGTTMPRRRRTCVMPCSATPAASSSAAPHTANAAATTAKPQVGSLKDVLQECNFLSLKDVLSAIADTHVHELLEAQQRLVGTHAVGSEGRNNDGILITPVVAPAAVNALPPCILGGVPPSVTSRPGGAGSEGACTSSAREGDSGTCLSMSTSTDTTCIPALHPSVCSLDPQQVMTLAAAITEVSLNLDRSVEASFSGSTTVAASSPAPPSVASRARLSGQESAPHGGFSAGDHISSGAVSASFSNLLAEGLPVGVAVSHLSTIATPSRARSGASSSSLVSTTNADASRFAAATSDVFLTTAAPAAAMDGFSEVLEHRCDPLERKVLLNPLSEGVDGYVENGMWESPEDRSLHTPSPSALMVAAASSPMTATSGAELRFPTAASSTSAHQHGGRCVPSWHGLTSAEAVSSKTAAPHTVVVVDWMPRIAPPPALQRQPETWASAASGTCSGRCVCKQDTAGDSTETATEASSKSNLTAGRGTLAAAGDVRVIIGSLSCLSFGDELSTVSQLRQWARSVAGLEHLQPSTDTEIIT